MPYATPDDFRTRAPHLGAVPELRLVALLIDATAIIDATLHDPSRVDLTVARSVACAMVRRALGDDADGTTDAPGARTIQQTAGPFAQTLTYANPTGELYVTAAERRALNPPTFAMFTIDLLPANVVPLRPKRFDEA